MNLKDMLSRVSYDARHESEGAEVIPLHGFDAARCEAEIKRLDNRALTIRNQITTQVKKYEETIATLENELEGVESELADWREKIASWARGLGALRTFGGDD